MFNGSKLGLGAVCAILLGAGATLPVMAIETLALDNASAAKPEGQVIEEVVVTARRREENLQEVPISVTAISGEALVVKGVQNLMDLQRFVPSMRVVNADVNPKIFFVSIRGIRGQNPRVTEDPPVSTYFAEVSVAHPFAFGDEMYDIQSAQVLKGPQGTLFGRNTTGGAVLIEPNKPSIESGVSGDLKLSLGEYNLRKVDGAANIPLNEVAALRVAGESYQRDGYTKNVLSGVKYDEINNQALRAQLLLKPTRDISSNTLVSYLKEDNAPASSTLWRVFPTSTKSTFGPALGTTVANIFQNLLAQQNALGPLKMVSAIGSNVITGAGIDGFSPTHCAVNSHVVCRQGSTPNEKTNATGLLNNTKIDFDGFSIKNIIGYRRLNHAITGYDILPGGFLTQGIQAQQFNHFYQTSDEFQVIGKALNDRLDWIGGVFAFMEHGEDSAPAYQSIVPLVVPNAAGTPQAWTWNRSLASSKSHAVFAQADYKLTEQWKLTAGARKTWDERNVDILNQATSAAGVTACTARNANNVPLPINACDLKGHTTSDAPTWNLSVEYQANADTLYYASLRKGYKSGGFSPLVNIPQKLVFQPEFIKELELGLKSDWTLAGMPIRSNAAVFYDKYQQEQLQVTNFVPGVGFVNYIDNVGSSHIYGGELEVTLLPTSRIELSGFLSYTKPQYDKYISTTAAGPLDLTSTTFGQNYAVSKWQGALSGSYRLPLDDNNGTIKFAADLSFRSKSPTDNNLANIARFGSAFTPQIVEPGRGILNVRADWNHPLGNPVNLAIYATNVTNKVYVLGGAPVVGVETVHLGEPRMYGVELSYRFGQGAKSGN